MQNMLQIFIPHPGLKKIRKVESPPFGCGTYFRPHPVIILIQVTYWERMAGGKLLAAKFRVLLGYACAPEMIRRKPCPTAHARPIRTTEAVLSVSGERPSSILYTCPLSLVGAEDVC